MLKDILLLQDSKLNIPMCSQNLITRDALIKLLNKCSDYRLSVISCSAGYGKTTLLSQWIQTLEMKVAWLTIDKSDNDPIRFIHYLLRAIRRIKSDGMDKSIELIEAQTTHEELEYLLKVILKDIEELDQEFVLILEDYHHIYSEDVHGMLKFIIDNRTEKMHLIISSRNVPPLHLAKMRMNNALLFLSNDELEFSKDEIGDFIQRTAGTCLSDEELTNLWQKVEGWPAATQIAQISMKGKENASDFIRGFSGSHRFIFDYFMDDVYAQLPVGIKEFLLATANLKRFNADLCNFITSRSNSQEVIEELEENNLFMKALDDEREWYRYHKMFSEFLIKKQKHDPLSRKRELDLQVGDWFYRNGYIPDAIEHLLKSSEFLRVEKLMIQHAETLLQEGKFVLIYRWICALPCSMYDLSPALLIVYAVVLILRGNHNLVKDIISWLEKNREVAANQSLTGRVHALKAIGSAYKSAFHDAEYNAVEAHKLLNERDSIWKSLASVALGNTLILMGPTESAIETFKEVYQSATVAKNAYSKMHSLAMICTLHLRHGNLKESLSFYELHMSKNQFDKYSCIPLLIFLCEYHYETDNLTKAKESIEKAIEIARATNYSLALHYCYMLLSRIYNAHGIQHKSVEIMEICKCEMMGHEVTPWFSSYIKSWEAFLAIKHKNLSDAQKIFEEGITDDAKSITYSEEIELLELCRYYYVSGEYCKAIDLLTALSKRLGDKRWLYLDVKTKILLSVVYEKAGNESEATVTFHKALHIGKTRGFCRVFKDEMDSIYSLLMKHKDNPRFSDYIMRLLSSNPTAELVQNTRVNILGIDVVLSRRETEVLKLLVTHLTSREIGRELYISMNTVRTHMRNIYSKLEVHSRDEAVDRARRLNLV